MLHLWHAPSIRRISLVDKLRNKELFWTRHQYSNLVSQLSKETQPCYWYKNHNLWPTCRENESPHHQQQTTIWYHSQTDWQQASTFNYNQLTNTPINHKQKPKPTVGPLTCIKSSFYTMNILKLQLQLQITVVIV